MDVYLAPIRYELRHPISRLNGHLVLLMDRMFRNYTLLALFLSFVNTVHSRAQEIELQSVKKSSEFHWRYGREKEFDSFYFNLPAVVSSSYTTHIRFALDFCLIDLHVNDSHQASGTLFYHIDQSPKQRRNKRNNNAVGTKYYYKEAIDSVHVPKLIRYFLQIPIDTFFYGETPATDSLYRRFGTSSFELRHRNKHVKHQHYWTHGLDLDDSTDRLLHLNYRPLTPLLNLDHGWDTLMRLLPRGRSYSHDGRSAFYYLSSKKDAKYRARWASHIDYMDSVRPSIDSFIQKIVAQDTAYFSTTSYDGFFFKFSKKGHLLRVTTRESYLKRISDSDFRKARRILFSSFRKKPIDFIEPEKAYWHYLRSF